MSSVRLSGRRKVNNEENSPLSKRVLKNVVSFYLFMMMAVYPLYYENKYFNMGDAKWHFFRNVTAVGLAVIALVFLWYQIHLIKVDRVTSFWDIKKMSYLDAFVLLYAAVALISFALSPYKETTLLGYDGWYMGLISQLAFVIIYYFVSRFYRWDEILLVIYMVVSVIVFLLCVMNKFMVDPLEMYADIEPYYIHLFVSTMGQVTWFSSYMIIMFPVGLFAFWYYDKKIIRILSAFYVVLGGTTMIAQNSDSGIIGYAAAYLVLFCFSFADNTKMQRFLESVFLLFVGWKIMGLLQTAFPENIVELSHSMTSLGQGNLTWALIAVSGILCIAFDRMAVKGSFDISDHRMIRNVILYIIGGGTILLVIYIALNTKGVLEGTPLASDSNYLYFDKTWGNNRGLSWMAATGTIIKSDWVTKLFGAGPDGFYNSVYRFYSRELIEKWGQGTALTCAHNEWLNAFVNMGIIGGILYAGIFICAIVRFAKKADVTGELVAPAMCVAAYMAHNFFCYQQIICTPLIFIVIGIGEQMARDGKVPIWLPDGE